MAKISLASIEYQVHSDTVMSSSDPGKALLELIESELVALGLKEKPTE